jgi:predicted nucleotidyltransferase
VRYEYGLNEKQLGEIESILAKHFGFDSVWLFGSRAHGTNRVASDIDLAIKGVSESRMLILTKGAFESSSLPYGVCLYLPLQVA